VSRIRSGSKKIVLVDKMNNRSVERIFGVKE
jgi:hypothetical protein